jgi:hypothetical protein
MLALLQPVWRVASFGAFAALLVPFQILAHAADPEIAVRPPSVPRTAHPSKIYAAAATCHITALD